jgi:cytochrome c-type biogenesis protein CcsB
MVNFLSYSNLLNLFSNLSFVTLFFSMIAYWIETSRLFIDSSNDRKKLVLETSNVTSPSFLQDEEKFKEQTSSNLTNLKKFNDSNELNKVYGNGFVGNNENALLKSQKYVFDFKFGHLFILISNLSLLILLNLRWIESGHFPLSNLYESLLFLSWALSLFHLIIEKLSKNSFGWLGAITSPMAFFTIAFAQFSLPLEMQRSSALVPALQSNWLMMHVTVMILSYAALIFGSLLAIAFLILTLTISSEDYETLSSSESLETKQFKNYNSKIRWAQNLDNLSYRMLGIGFPLLTIGILSGAVWANEAWGSYWSWDPKETWALLTWLIFAIYLHTRITKNWKGKKPAIIASFGFFIVWVCYLGVNLLGEGLHSYGWLRP